MRECYLSFSSVAELREFVSLATQQTFPVTLERNGLSVNATAIMSVFSMGLHTPLRLQIPNRPETAAFFSAIEAYKALCC